MRWFSPRKKGTAPDGFVPVMYREDYPAHFYQEHWNWPWPPAPAHEQRGALTNAWNGNQLPGPTNFIPGVPLSKGTWNVPTSYANSLRNQQFNAGFNIQGYSAWQNATLQQQVQLQWQNRVQP